MEAVKSLENQNADGNFITVSNSPAIAAKFFILAGLGIILECMVIFFIYIMWQDDGVEWTAELRLYVAAALILPVLIAVLGIVGGKGYLQGRILFDGEKILVKNAFRTVREISWNSLGGIVKNGGTGFTLMDKSGKRVLAANNTMLNYNAFYDTAIRKCRDYRKDRQRESTGAFAGNAGRLRVDSGYPVLTFTLCLAASVFIMGGIMALVQENAEADEFFQVFPAWAYILIMAFFPVAGLCVELPIQFRKYWEYTDYEIVIHSVWGRQARLSWGQINRAEISAFRTPAGENYGFTLYTASGIFRSGKLLTKGNANLVRHMERMAEKYGFMLVRQR